LPKNNGKNKACKNISSATFWKVEENVKDYPKVEHGRKKSQQSITYVVSYQRDQILITPELPA
jgi:hypothetical protein